MTSHLNSYRTTDIKPEICSASCGTINRYHSFWTEEVWISKNYEFKICTPVPKVHPTQKISILRNISDFLKFDFIKLLQRILPNNSKGDVFAVIVNLTDWNYAFPWQCPKLGIEFFIENGVRPSLILLLFNYFQNRKMSVKGYQICS